MVSGLVMSICSNFVVTITRLALQLIPSDASGKLTAKMPEPPVQIHTIKTDDPFGVEAYWHRKFASKQIDRNSEWFQLSPADVRAFRKWTRIF